MERKKGMPLWVFLGLANINTRKGALILLWSSIIVTVFCFPLSYYVNDWSWALMMLPVPVWYHLAIRWVDRHALWHK